MPTYDEVAEKAKRGEELTGEEKRILVGRVWTTGAQALLWVGLAGLCICYLLGWRP